MKNCYRLAGCSLLFFCIMGKAFGDEYERFVNEVLEEPELTQSNVVECLKKASGYYKSSILEGFFPFDEEKIPLISTKATAKVDLLYLMASFYEGNIIKKCYQILSLHAQDFQYGEYYQKAWNLLEEIAFKELKNKYKISDEQGKDLMQRLCSIALGSVDSYLPEEVIEKTLETIEEQLRGQSSDSPVATGSNIPESDPENLSDSSSSNALEPMVSDSNSLTSSSESSKSGSESSEMQDYSSDSSM